jgi:SPP1 gp7 family putative phage head morphogenesis protein
MPADSAFILEPSPHTEAAAWIESKPVVSREVFDTLLPDLQGRAFLISGVEDANLAADIRATIADLPRGESWEDSKRVIVGKLGAWFEPKAANARATLLLRTHGFQSYRTAAHAVMVRQAGVFPFWQYLTVGDERVRPSHRALDGIVAPANSPFWDDKPGGWGCRCRKVPILPEEAAEIRAEDSRKPLEEQRILDGPRLAAAEQGRLVRAVRDDQGRLLRDPIHAWPVANPAKVGVAQTLTIPPSDLRSRYDAETWAEFESAAKKQRLADGRTVWEWLNAD